MHLKPGRRPCACSWTACRAISRIRRINPENRRSGRGMFFLLSVLGAFGGSFFKAEKGGEGGAFIKREI